MRTGEGQVEEEMCAREEQKDKEIKEEESSLVLNDEN